MQVYKLLLRDVEGVFMSEIRSDWYLMYRTRLLRDHGDGITTTEAPRHRSSLANALERRGLVARESQGYRYRFEGGPVLAYPLVLTAEGLRALDVWNANRSEPYEV